ncbi:MAG: tyrosine--tRNA ligase [Verrucomicrobiales bacterium]
MLPAPDQLAVLTRGCAAVISEDDLLAKLREGRPLKVKLGVDPTAPDIHLGHIVAMEKLRQFQDLGHTAQLLIGDFTALIGDPTGRSATRPPLTHDEVEQNAATYTSQAFKVLDRAKTEIVWNGDWFKPMDFSGVVRLCSRVTLQQMLQREDFRARLDAGTEIRLHEILYPIMQGWDSVEMRADVELGGTDQLFNILVGRDLQKAAGQSPQVVMTMPLLEGTDGVRKMSKSYGNYIGVDEPASEIFGKTMSISDDLMKRWYVVLLGEELAADAAPMEAKKSLAQRLAARFAGAEAAAAARAEWDTRFSKKDLASAELPIFSPPAGAGLLVVLGAAYDHCFGIKKSNSDLRRLVEQGSVQADGQKLTDPQSQPSFAPGTVLKLDKRNTVRIQ